MKNLEPKIYRYCHKLQNQLNSCRITPSDIPSACGMDADGACYCNTEALVVASKNKSQTKKGKKLITHVLKSLMNFAYKNHLLQLLMTSSYINNYKYYTLSDVGTTLDNFQCAYNDYYHIYKYLSYRKKQTKSIIKNLEPKIHRYCQPLQNRVESYSFNLYDSNTNYSKKQIEEAQNIMTHVIKSLTIFAYKYHLLQLLVTNSYVNNYTLSNVDTILNNFQHIYKDYYYIHTQLSKELC